MNMFDAENSIAKATLDMCRKEPKAVHYNYTGGVLAGGVDIPFYQIITVNTHRDFVNNFADEINIEVIMDTRKFYESVCTNLDNLIVYVRRKQMAENSMLTVMGGINEYKKYKAILHNPPTQGLINDKRTGNNKIVNPDQSWQKATFQLTLESIVELKLTKWSGLLDQTTPANALQMILSGTSDGAVLDKGMNIKGVNMSPPDVTDPKDIIVPWGTLVKDCAQLLQQQYGIYNFGIGSYIFGEHWFVYPLFNTKRYTKEPFKLAITVVSMKHEMIPVPRTYYVDSGIVTMYTSLGTEYEKNDVGSQLNGGTGIQVINPIENQKQSFERNDNDVKVTGGQLSTINITDRKDSLDNVTPIYEKTTNMANLVSKVAGNRGNYITITWRFSNPDLLQPGMPVKIVYASGARRELYGVLHEYHAISKRANGSPIDTPFTTATIMRIYVESE